MRDESLRGGGGDATTWVLGTCSAGGGSEYAGVQGGVSAGVRDRRLISTSPASRDGGGGMRTRMEWSSSSLLWPATICWRLV